MTTASPKPKHQTVAGRVRINLFGGAGSERHRPVNVLLERRRDENSDDWYPAAGFKADELPSLEQAAKAMHEYLTKPNEKVSQKEPAPPPQESPTPSRRESEADDSDESEPVEDPPFTPNRPAPSSPAGPSRSTVQTATPASPKIMSPPSSPTRSKSPSRPPAIRPPTRPDPTRKALGRKSKVRGR